MPALRGENGRHAPPETLCRLPAHPPLVGPQLPVKSPLAFRITHVCRLTTPGGTTHRAYDRGHRPQRPGSPHWPISRPACYKWWGRQGAAPVLLPWLCQYPRARARCSADRFESRGCDLRQQCRRHQSHRCQSFSHCSLLCSRCSSFAPFGCRTAMPPLVIVPLGPSPCECPRPIAPSLRGRLDSAGA